MYRFNKKKILKEDDSNKIVDIHKCFKYMLQKYKIKCFSMRNLFSIGISSHHSSRLMRNHSGVTV